MKDVSNSPAVSVIIPVYNLEKYLEPCLESVARQTFPDFEAIVVDDGSTDGSLEAIRRYVAGDARFKVVATPNQGVARARETVLSRAGGEYVCFLDGDDWWELDMLEKMIGAIRANGGYDIVCCNFMRVCPTYRAPVRERLTADLQGNDFLREVMCLGMSPALCGKCYRRVLFDASLRHYPLRRGQDGLVNMQIGCRSPRVRFLDYAGYNYLQRPGSEIHSPMAFDYCKSYAEAVADIFRRNAGAVDARTAEFLRVANSLWWYAGYINRSSSPWVGDDPFVESLREGVATYRKELQARFSRSRLLMFRMDRWRAMRPAVVCLLTLRRWGHSLRRRFSH